MNAARTENAAPFSSDFSESIIVTYKYSFSITCC